MRKISSIPVLVNFTASANAKRSLHPRNRHQGEYDFAALIACSPQLLPFVLTNAYGNRSIDFADANSVRALNRALLHSHYGIAHWELPEGYLCPPIPGRADYVHGLADLLASDHGGVIPSGPAVRVLDIGTGASGIYALIAASEYGWSVVGSDIDATALTSAQAIVQANPGLDSLIELRTQQDRSSIFNGVVRDNEQFALTLCNPPFHASVSEATQASERKRRNLGTAGLSARNFGGQRDELCCRGGEFGFVSRMIDESAAHATRILWFSSLVAKGTNLPALQARLQKLGAGAVRTVAMSQGQKQSRFVAWSFLDAFERAARVRRWN